MLLVIVLWLFWTSPKMRPKWLLPIPLVLGQKSTFACPFRKPWSYNLLTSLLPLLTDSPD